MLGLLPSADLIDRALFPAPKVSYDAESFPGELIWIPGAGGEGVGPDERIPCLLLRSASARILVIAFHGNGDDLGRFRSFISRLRVVLRVHVLAVEYPGYGICPGGQATPASANANARAAFRFARQDLKWPAEEILLFGRSIGCGPALSVAAENDNVFGLIMVSPLSSLKQLLRDKLGPLADLVDERLPHLDLVKRVKSKLLVVHGIQDDMVPYRHGKALFEAACQCEKHIVLPEPMAHNTNLYNDKAFFAKPVWEFFELCDWGNKPVSVPSWVFAKPLARHDGGVLSTTLSYIRNGCCCAPRDHPPGGTVVCVTGMSALGAAPSMVEEPDGTEADEEMDVGYRSVLCCAAKAPTIASLRASGRRRSKLPSQPSPAKAIRQPRHGSPQTYAGRLDEGRQWPVTLGEGPVLDADEAGLEVVEMERGASLASWLPCVARAAAGSDSAEVVDASSPAREEEHHFNDTAGYFSTPRAI